MFVYPGAGSLGEEIVPKAAVLLHLLLNKLKHLITFSKLNAVLDVSDVLSVSSLLDQSIQDTEHLFSRATSRVFVTFRQICQILEHFFKRFCFSTGLQKQMMFVDVDFFRPLNQRQ